MSVMFKQGIILAYDFDVQARQDCTPDQEAIDCGDTLLIASQIRQLKARCCRRGWAALQLQVQGQKNVSESQELLTLN